MTHANIELLNALREAGVSEETAQAAARASVDSSQVATKADLAQMETRLTLRMVSVAGITASIVIGALALMLKLWV